MRFRRRFVLLLLTVAMTFIARAWAETEPITLTVKHPLRSVPNTDTELYTGKITNNTRLDLTGSGLFLNFSGFDPVRVKLTQVLGSPNFILPADTTSATFGLFKLTLGPRAPGRCYLTDVVLQNTAGTFSAPVTVTEIVKNERGDEDDEEEGERCPKEDGRCPSPPASPVLFSTTPPGASLESETRLAIALPIRNNGTSTAENVQISSIALANATPATSLPISLGSIPADDSTVLQFQFSGPFAPDTEYSLNVVGTYMVGTATYGFSLNQAVAIPEASPGSAELTQATGTAEEFSGGGFPPETPHGHDQALSPWAVPLGEFVAPTEMTPESRVVEGLTAGLRAQSTAAPPVDIFRNSGIGFFGVRFERDEPEPSGATSPGGVVFVTGNYFAAFSAGGGTFTVFDPTTLAALKDKNGETVDGGFCCDQVVQYIPQIDRFVWLVEYWNAPSGQNRIRLLVASPAEVISSSATKWRVLDITSGTLRIGNRYLDYSDLSVGDNFLYVSTNVVGGTTSFGPIEISHTSGLIVIRIPLTDLVSGNSFRCDHTKQPNGRIPFLGHLTQNTGDEVFWAGHRSNSIIRVFSCAENSNRYYWRDRRISSWPAANVGRTRSLPNKLSSTTPDGKDWLSYLRKLDGPPVSAATRVSRSGVLNQIWFGWTAYDGVPCDSPICNNTFSFPQPHVEVVVLDRDKDFAVVRRFPFWNATQAIAYPAFATNSNLEVGFSLGWGGNGKYASHAVGFLQDFVFYSTTTAEVGTNRWGDYVTIRQDGQDPSRFAAFGYGLKFLGPDVRFVLFRRQGLIP